MNQPSKHDQSSRRTPGGGERVFLIGIDVRHVGAPSPKSDNLEGASTDDLDQSAPSFPGVGKGGTNRRAGRGLTSGVRAARNAAHVTESAKLSRTPEFSAEESLAELRELAISAGATIAGEFLQYRDRLDPATLIGKGKLEEIAGAVESQQIAVVIFDHELSPSQQRNIERIVHTRVVDRTQLILDIFASAARTREGQLQVELAQLKYMLPRLGGRGIEMSQLGGGIGTRGPGETQLETDRRKINRRIRHLESQIEEVRRIRAQQRQRREAAPIATVALVGYTNAGKSTTFNAITKAGVFESAKMFATLDPTIRAIQLPSKRRVLLSDTVGFIRHLPHTLVTAFRATLEEVERATIILHVSDATSPILPEQDAQVMEVLRELDADRKPRIHVMNKVDLLEPRQRESLIDTPVPSHTGAPFKPDFGLSGEQRTRNAEPGTDVSVPHPRAGEAGARVGLSDSLGENDAGAPSSSGVGSVEKDIQSGAPFKPDVGLSGVRGSHGTLNSEPGFGFEGTRNLERGTSVVHISATTGQGLTSLLEHIDAVLEDDPLRRVHLRIPQSEGKALSQIEAGARIYARSYKDGFVEMDIQAPESVVRRVREWVVGK